MTNDETITEAGNQDTDDPTDVLGWALDACESMGNSRFDPDTGVDAALRIMDQFGEGQVPVEGVSEANTPPPGHQWHCNYLPNVPASICNCGKGSQEHEPDSDFPCAEPDCMIPVVVAGSHCVEHAPVRREQLQHRLVGYFTDGSQTDPAYDPGVDVPCIVCMRPMPSNERCTVSIALLSSRKRSLFYRAHKACEEEGGGAIADAIIDWEVGSSQGKPRDTHMNPTLPSNAEQDVYEVVVRVRVPAVPDDFWAGDFDQDALAGRAIASLALDSPDDVEVAWWGVVAEAGDVSRIVWKSREWIR